MEKIKIDTTKRGFAAMWESGGGYTSHGSSIVITGRNGEPRRPIYVPRGGHLACGNHALIGIAEGFYIVKASVRHGSRSSTSIAEIKSISVKDIHGEKFEASAEVETVNTFSEGEWDRPLEQKFESAVEAAFRKAGVYHCRSAYYVDSSEKPQVSKEEQQKRDEKVRQQDEERARLRQEKAEADAKAKAEAEAASKAAKESGLGARLEAVNIRLLQVEKELVEIEEVSFRFKCSSQYYTEEAISNVEKVVSRFETEKSEKKLKQIAREKFQPKFEAFQSRIDALGLVVEFTEKSVKFKGGGPVKPYSNEGLLQFVEELDKREREAAEAKAKAEAELLYQERKTKAMKLGLPTDIQIWCRRGGRTGAGDGWVIGADGRERTNTAWYNENPRRLQRYGEGFKIWEQILEGEVVLKWSKSCSAAKHEFEVLYIPKEGLTEVQLERVLEIQDELETQWEGARGFASGIPSPPVGEGWGFTSSPKKDWTIDDLKVKFNSR